MARAPKTRSGVVLGGATWLDGPDTIVFPVEVEDGPDAGRTVHVRVSPNMARVLAANLTALTEHILRQALDATTSKGETP